MSVIYLYLAFTVSVSRLSKDLTWKPIFSTIILLYMSVNMDIVDYVDLYIFGSGESFTVRIFRLFVDLIPRPLSTIILLYMSEVEGDDDDVCILSLSVLSRQDIRALEDLQENNSSLRLMDCKYSCSPSKAS